MDKECKRCKKLEEKNKEYEEIIEIYKKHEKEWGGVDRKRGDYLKIKIDGISNEINTAKKVLRAVTCELKKTRARAEYHHWTVE